MSLFSSEIPPSEDAGFIKSEAKKLDWNFAYAALASFVEEPLVSIKKDLEVWYSELEIFLDDVFSDMIKKDFHQRVWELYCGKLLSERFKLSKKSENGLPDFLVHIQQDDVWVEATAPDNGSDKHGNKVFLLRDELRKNGYASYGGLISERTDPIVLRAKAAIQKKQESYRSTYTANGVSTDKPFVIAINSYLFDDGNHPDQVILHLFFEMGNQVVFFGKNSGSTPEGIFREQRGEAKSLKGDQVEVGMFRSNQYAEISAIIFTPKDIFNLERDKNKIGSDVFVIFNPFAKNKILPETFSFCTRVTAEGDGVRFEKP